MEAYPQTAGCAFRTVMAIHHEKENTTVCPLVQIHHLAAGVHAFVVSAGFRGDKQHIWLQLCVMTAYHIQKESQLLRTVMNLQPPPHFRDSCCPHLHSEVDVHIAAAALDS